MTRKFLAIVLTLCMLLSLGTVAHAEKIEFIKNGDFETVNSGAASGWAVSGGAWGEVFSVSDDAHGGKGALRITATGNAYAHSRISGLTAGVEYTITGYVKTLKASSEDDGGAAIKTEFFKNGEYATGGAMKFYNGKVGEWKAVEYTFKCPENANAADILLRSIKGADVVWDDISLLAEKVVEEKKEVAIDGETEEVEFFTNGSFEEVNGDAATGWATNGGKWGQELKVEKDAKDGKKALHITTEGNTYVSSKIRGLIPGVEYTITGFVKLLKAPGEDGTGAAIKLEYFNKGAYEKSGAIKF